MEVLFCLFDKLNLTFIYLVSSKCLDDEEEIVCILIFTKLGELQTLGSYYGLEAEWIFDKD